MKKLLLLCLVLLGGGLQVNAANVTRRIYVVTPQNFMSYRNTSVLKLHAEYSDNSGEVANVNMNSFAGTASYSQKPPCMWFTDITFDDSKTIKFSVSASENSGWHSGNTIEFTSTTDSYYYWNSENNGDLSVRGTVTYYAYTYDGENWTKNALVTEDRVSYTYTIDNITANNSSLQLLIAPSFAIEDDFFTTGWVENEIPGYKWEMILRPSGEESGSTTVSPGFTNVINHYCGGFSNSSDYINLDAKAYYTLTFKPYSWQFSLSPYFTRDIKSASEGYATFSSPYAVAIPENITAKYPTGISSNAITWGTFSNGIAANQGALLVGTPGTYTFTPATSTDAISANENITIEPIAEKTQLAQSTVSGYTNFILSLVSGHVGFHKVNSNKSWVNAGTAYLKVANSSISPAREFFALDDETTEINTLDNLTNSQLDINAPIYNLAGQRVGKNYKGVVIVNGKKVIKK